ncbi:polysaccharide biosynthesis protein [Rhodophyticola sp. CCM32]|uniref:polysaccharide biosynthesis protein n=1 Tax=Rhodophyticola sp. CCM32 TaxID=2916397 RepID=UPI00107F6127|nr:nucleoside-diphosphate sugar epimerase/dehydratase [Rhodophyticola sp. CCM32]QBY01312.1 polysaccharide biosynthesis protein [Rhodophyticola sp. CCM32]
MRGLSSTLLNLGRSKKIALVIAMDGALTALSLYLAIALRLNSFDLLFYSQGWALCLIGLLPAGIALSIFLSIPWISVRSFNLHGIARLGLFAVLLGVLLFLINTWVFFLIPRSAPLIFIPILAFLTVWLRLSFDRFIEPGGKATAGQERVLIYGAGAAGVQLANALKSFDAAEAVAFVDDNPAMHKVLIGALRIYGPKDINGLIKEKNVTEIVLAMPSASRARKQQILRGLSDHGVTLRTMPHFIDFMTGQAITGHLQTVTSEDLLGRLPQALDMPEIAADYMGRNVLVTGAGGSIGSELSLQLASVPARKIVLFDHSEVALYDIERRLRAAHVECQIVPILASVLAEDHLRQALVEHDIEIVLHAAAYKHVPLVENNEISGARNNIIGTYQVAQTVAEIGIARFILISTDKAVRPTNVMGATKRFAEMLVQDLQTRHPKTVFSMVRFGNVLGSSGSVIPLFREQISKGGPLTVTHPEVTRFFMTLSEAARLVLLAGTFARGGEVFVLDMGKPVRIVDLARNMIAFCGLTERTTKNPRGDIEVIYTGLREGEKLYEELLIDDSQVPTPHNKIMCAREPFLNPEETAEALCQLKDALDRKDAGALRKLFTKTVAGYTNGAVS